MITYHFYFFATSQKSKVDYRFMVDLVFVIFNKKKHETIKDNNLVQNPLIYKFARLFLNLKKTRFTIDLWWTCFFSFSKKKTRRLK